MTSEADLFRMAATVFQTSAESFASTLRYLRTQVERRGADANDIAIEFGMSLQLATRLLEDEPDDILADEIGTWRASAITRLIQDVYQDLDSYRNGLLCCRLEDPATLVISAAHPCDEYCEKYQKRAEALALTLSWLKPRFSLLDVKDHLAELDHQAAINHAAPPAGRIGELAVTVTTDSQAVQEWISDQWQWARLD